jgi:hypothetical protein
MIAYASYMLFCSHDTRGIGQYLVFVFQVILVAFRLEAFLTHLTAALRREILLGMFVRNEPLATTTGALDLLWSTSFNGHPKAAFGRVILVEIPERHKGPAATAGAFDFT